MHPLTALKRHRAFFILIAFAATLFLSDIWSYKEFVRAESYFALGARLMIEQSEWLAPHAPDESQLNKPPLAYWLTGLSYKLFGASYGSARLPVVVCALCILAFVYSLGVWLDGIRSGLTSAAVLASSYLFLTFARTAMSDMLLALCVTASLTCFIFALAQQTVRSGRLIISGYVPLALGVLTKGPVALVLVAAPIILALGWSRNRAAVKQLLLGRGSLVFLAIAAPYFVLVYRRLGAEPLRFFFLGENIRRFTGEVYGSSSRPFWFELAAFFSDFAPWSLLIFTAVWFDWRARGSNEIKDQARHILYLWLGSTIFLFSLSSFKLVYYLLPAMPAAALIIGSMVAGADEHLHLARRMMQAFLVLCSLIIVVIAFLVLKAAVILSNQSFFRFMPLVIAVGGAAVISLHLKRRKLWRAAMILIVVMWATILTTQLALLPAFTRYLPATQLAARVPSDRIWYTSWAASDWANCIAFNLAPPHRVERLVGDAGNERLLAALKNDSRAVVVIWEREYAELATKDPELRVLAQAETYGRGGLNLKMVRQPRRERLMLVGH